MVVTSIAITVTGIICYFIPGCGWLIGGILTSAGLGGLFKALSEDDLSWEDFWIEVGISAVIGGITAGIGRFAQGIKIFEKLWY